MKKYRQVLGIIFIFLIFLCLRLYRLGFHDFWYDEIGTISYAQYPWGNWNAPFYWVLLHFWIKIFGISEFGLRFPSLIFSFLSVILVYLLGKKLFNQKVGIIVSIFMGLSPFHLWYAQEARDYSMVLFFGLLSNWLFYKALREGENKLWLFFILVSIIGLYTNYFYIFLFLTQFSYLIFFAKLRMNSKVKASFLIIALSFSLYLPRFLSKFFYVWAGFWIVKPKWKFLIITLENFILGYNGSPILYLITDILTVVFLISIFRIIRKKNELREGITFCISLCFIPIICIFFFSKVLFSVYLDRGLIIFSPYFYIVLSLGVISLNKIIKLASFAILIPLFLITDYKYFKDQIYLPKIHHRGVCIKKPFKPVTKFIKDNLKAGDIIAFTNFLSMSPFTFYSRQYPTPFYYFFDPKFNDPNWQRPVQETSNQVPFYKINYLEFERLWVIYSDWARSGKLDENSQSVKDWCDKNFKLKSSHEFDGLWVLVYKR